MLRFLPFAAIAGVLLSAGRAAAAPTGRLVYSRAPGAESCPDEAMLRRSVAARVGYDPFFPWAKRTVVANLARRSRDFVAIVSLVDEQGVAHGDRELRTSGDCAELLDAMALAIAIAIDPEILTRPAPSSPLADGSEPSGVAHGVVGEPVAPPAAVTPSVFVSPARPDVPTSSQPPPATRPANFEATLGALVSSGSAPDLAAGLSAGAQVRWRHVSVGVEGQVEAPASRSVQGGGDVSAWPVLGAIVPCAYFGAFLACAVAQGGALRVSSGGVPDQRATWTALWQAGARAGVLIPVGEKVSLRVRSDLLVNLDRARLGLRGAPVWTAPSLDGSLGIDAVVRFR
ncbi:MAG TPA: hypothetical protein VK762_28695 [Polyangiaceae bacterium]|nr:hypothetical protein [Polyangiaceae bacterium]